MIAVPVSASAAIGKAVLSDVALIFNLVQLGSAQGCFSNLYLQPRYQAGLALQLFSIYFVHKIRLPGGAWFRAELSVMREAGRFAGFALVRKVSPSRRELYMCAVEPELRGKGYGRALVEKALADLPPGCALEAECLPAAVMMRELLPKLGFEQMPGAAQGAIGVSSFRRQPVGC